jgi:putative chitinase
MPPICTETHLRAFLPKLADPPGWLMALDEAMERFDIDSVHRACAFFAQIAHESAEFRRLTENLNYSAKGLMNTWPTRFPTEAKAAQYARQPERIANHVYANRLSNGDEASADGWRYRGRGLLQITGRGNYRSCGRALALPLEAEPDLLTTPRVAALAAAQFWQSRGLNELADDRSDDNDEKDFERISILINGGRVGMADRKLLWGRAKAAFGV